MVKGKSMRLTIGDVGAWGIAAAQKEARRLQIQIDQGDVSMSEGWETRCILLTCKPCC